MKVLTVNCVDTGSTGSIINSIEKNLYGKCEFEICYERGQVVRNSNRYRITPKIEFLFYYAFGRLTGIKYGTGYTSTIRLLMKIKRTHPDVVHVHCPNTNSINLYMLFSYLKKKEIPTVITNHAEFYYTGNCPHSFECLKFQSGCGECDYVFDPYRPYLFDRTRYEWKKMYDSFQNYKKLIMIAVSPWQEHRMRLSPIVKDLNIRTIMNGVDTDVFHYMPGLFEDKTGKKILHVTAGFSNGLDDLKGGRYIIQLAKIMPEYEFTVVGPCVNINERALPTNIKLTGAIKSKKELARLYSGADITVIVSKRETFGMVCAESLCCGTPVIGFSAGGPESIAMLDNSVFVDYGDIEQLKKEKKKTKKMQSADKEKLSQFAQKKYSCRKMASSYYEIYKEVIAL